MRRTSWLLVLLFSPMALGGGANGITLDIVARTPPSQAIGWAGGGNTVQLSADGRYVVHSSSSQHLFTGQQDQPDTPDVFVYDRQSGAHQLVSHVAGNPSQSCGGQVPYGSRTISADARWIAFESSCQSPGSGNVYLYDRDTQTLRLLSKVPGTGLPAGLSKLLDISDDGRWVLLASYAQSIAPGATSNQLALFLVDREDPSGALQLVVSRSGAQAIDRSTMSANGRYVAFSSTLPNLDPAVPDNDLNSQSFVYDRSTGTTRMVSRIPGQNVPVGSAVVHSGYVFSANGQLFYPSSVGVFPFPSQRGILVYDPQLDQHAMMVPAESTMPVAASSDGQWLLYTQFGAGTRSVWLANRAGNLIPVDRGPVAGSPANGPGYPVALSADGNRVLFLSKATDLVPGVLDGNGSVDVYAYDRSTDTRVLLSGSAQNRLQAGNGESGRSEGLMALSADGQSAAFASGASNLAAGVVDANSAADLFVTGTGASAPQLLTSTLLPVPLSTPFSYVHHVSADGRWITWDEYLRGLMLRDLQTGAEWLVGQSHANPGTPANSYRSPTALSADGRWVWFVSPATDLIPGFVSAVPPGNRPTLIYQFDRLDGSVILLSHADGLPATGLANNAHLGGVSADGRWTLFSAKPQGLVAGVAADAPMQVFLYDRENRSARLVSQSASSPGSVANGESGALGLSANGRWVLYRSLATNLIQDVVDTNGGSDVFLFDRDFGTTRLVSNEINADLRAANAPSEQAVISPDGAWVVLQSLATNLMTSLDDTNQGTDVFRVQVATGQVTLVSRQAGQPLRTANGASELVEVPLPARVYDDVNSLGANGGKLVLRTLATDLVAGVSDLNGDQDVYRIDLATAAAQLLTHLPGMPLQAAPANSYEAMISADGERVMLQARGTALVAGATPSEQKHVYLNDAQGNRLVTQGPAGVGDSGSLIADLDARGELLLLVSSASNLVPGLLDTNSTTDGFLARAPGDRIHAHGFED